MPAPSKSIIAALVVAGIAAGAAATYFVVTRSRAGATGARASAPTEAPADPSAPRSVVLTPDLIAGTSIKIGAVVTAPLPREIPLTAVIESNVTQQSTVVARISGRVTRADFEVGQTVQHGQVLAELSSPELVEAERGYLTARSQLQTHDAAHARLEKLLEIGAIPRQDVERSRAQQAALTTEVDAARARLDLFGMGADQIALLVSSGTVTPTTTVIAPSDGVLMVRNVSAEATVLTGEPLFTVANLVTVWATGEISVTDLGRVHLGNPVAASAAAAPDVKLSGTVSYIDPQVNLQTKATKVRADVTNNEQLALRPGMPVDLVITADESGPTVMVPRRAVERIDDRHVVFVADPKTPNRFIERTIEVGHDVGDMMQVVSGLAEGDTIVTDGVGLVSAQASR